jgi:hypothetical protein
MTAHDRQTDGYKREERGTGGERAKGRAGERGEGVIRRAGGAGGLDAEKEKRGTMQRKKTSRDP